MMARPPRDAGRTALIIGVLAVLWIPLAWLPAMLNFQPRLEGLAGSVAGLLASFLIMALPGLALITAPWAIVAGGRALRRGCRRRRAAVAAVVLGSTSFALLVLTVGTVFWRALGKARQEACFSNVDQLQLSLLMYAADHEGRFPPADNWPTSTHHINRNSDLYLCPADRRRERQATGGLETSYTMNAALSGMEQAKVPRPEEVAMLWDGLAVAGGRETAAYRHMKGLNVTYADGHRKKCTKEESARLRLEPSG